MFLERYLDEFYYNMVLDNYEYEYLKTLDEDNFKEVYNLLKKYNFYFINDLKNSSILIELSDNDKARINREIVSLKSKLA